MNHRKGWGRLAATRILLLDDNDIFRKMTRITLESEGYEVVDAADARTALASYRDNAPDLVITDILLPGTDGLEVIAELRRLNRAVRIIAISGADPERVDLYLKLAGQ